MRMSRALLYFLGVPIALCCGGESTPPDAGSTPAADAGIVADSGRPSCPIGCASLDLAMTRFDPATRVLELVIKDSAPAATSGSITAMLGLFPLGGAPSTTSKSAVLTVNARRLSIDLSPWLTPEVVTFGPVSLTLVGECGMTSTFGLGVLTQGRGPQLSLTGFQCL